MNNEGRLCSQVAAQAGVTPDKALTAVYLSNLAKAGKTIDQAAALARLHRSDVRNVARDWGFQFVDYKPGAPARLTWQKLKRGSWALHAEDGTSVAVADADGKGGYTAALDVNTRADGSSALVAARRLSRAIDRRARDLFGTDDVLIIFEHPEGWTEHLAPPVAENPGKLRAALAA
jgi:hypothetical protein